MPAADLNKPYSSDRRRLSAPPHRVLVHRNKSRADLLPCVSLDGPRPLQLLFPDVIDSAGYACD